MKILFSSPVLIPGSLPELGFGVAVVLGLFFLPGRHIDPVLWIKIGLLSVCPLFFLQGEELFFQLDDLLFRLLKPLIFFPDLFLKPHDLRVGHIIYVLVQLLAERFPL